MHTFDCGQGAVLSLTVRADTAYAGCQDGYVKVLDLETRTCVRTIIVQEARVFLVLIRDDLNSCCMHFTRVLTSCRYPC